MNPSHGFPCGRRRRCLLWRRLLKVLRVLPFPKPTQQPSPSRFPPRASLPLLLTAQQYAFQIRANIRRRAALLQTKPCRLSALNSPGLSSSARDGTAVLYSHQPKCVGMLTEPRRGRTVMCVMQLSGVGCRSTGCLLRLPARTSSSHHCVYVTGFKWPRKTRRGGRFTDFDSFFIALCLLFQLGAFKIKHLQKKKKQTTKPRTGNLWCYNQYSSMFLPSPSSSTWLFTQLPGGSSYEPKLAK